MEDMNINEYNVWIGGIARRYKQSQIKAATVVNVELLKFYWSLGADIVRMEKDRPWGTGFMARISRDLQNQMPNAKCFSARNLYYIENFYLLYAGGVILPQVGAKLECKPISPQAEANKAILPQVGGNLMNVANCPQVEGELDHEIFHIPWGHHKYLIDKFMKDPAQALFYVRETLKNGWSRSVLLNFIDSDLYARQGKAVSNFALRLADPESDLAQEITKDPYDFRFLALTERYREKDLKDALMANVEKFLLELGQGFMLVGREYRLEIGQKEKFADLLFFHMNLNAYVVVEVKVGEFESEHLGQLGLYVSAVNHLLKKPQHAPTIGLLICKTKDNVMAKWALESASQPIGVSEYRLSQLLPKEIETDLPSVDEIESGLKFPDKGEMSSSCR